MGPRFANVFINSEKSDVHGEDLKCIIQCAGTVIRLAPCIATAVATENPLALLSCGINKGTVRRPLPSPSFQPPIRTPYAEKREIKVCTCVKCLPDSVKQFVGQFCSSSTLPASAKSDDTLSYPDWIQFSQRSPYLQGFRVSRSFANPTLSRDLLTNPCVF